MSCSVHDVVRFEKAGLPTAGVSTDGFIDEAEEQARLLGMPDYQMVWLPHPVATLDDEGIARLARESALGIIARLTGQALA